MHSSRLLGPSFRFTHAANPLSHSITRMVGSCSRYSGARARWPCNSPLMASARSRASNTLINSRMSCLEGIVSVSCDMHSSFPPGIVRFSQSHHPKLDHDFAICCGIAFTACLQDELINQLLGQVFGGDRLVVTGGRPRCGALHRYKSFKVTLLFVALTILLAISPRGMRPPLT